MTFREKWLEAVDRKNSVLCAGLDPAEFEMGRGEKGLPKGADKLEWSLKYVEAVAPDCAALKPNSQYWKAVGDLDRLNQVVKLAKDKGLLVIDDSKLADIGSTNDAGIYHPKKRGFDAVTVAPYAGNMREIAEQAKKRDLGAITMCLMSNSEYKREKLMTIDVGDDIDSYSGPDMLESSFVYRYIQLAHDAKKFGLDGVVIGVPSDKNHITNEEIEKVRQYVGDEMLVLLPGVGDQGGEASAIWKYFSKDNVAVNVGRSMMLPKGSNSTPEDQAETARHYKEMLNELRAA